MKTTRWHAGLVLLLSVSLTSPLQAQDWSKVRIHTVPLAENLYVLAGGGGNIALLVGEDGALMVDTGFEQLAEKITEAVGEVSKNPVRMVINTHWHFDHVGGNEHLAKTGAVIVAHKSTRKLMTEKRFIAVIDREMEPSPAAALPVITFDSPLTFHWNGEKVDVFPIEPAHSDGDCLVFFRTANVLHVGDTCFNGMYPFMDVNAAGSLDGMVAALDRALTLTDDKTTVIPGHGRLLNSVELKTYRDMLATVRDRVRALIDQGKSRAEIIAEKPTKEFDDRWGQSWLDADTWVGLVFDGMTAKKSGNR